MNQRRFDLVAGAIFAVIAIMHLARIVYGWNAVINHWSVPMWASWLAVVIAGCLAYQGLKLNKK